MEYNLNNVIAERANKTIYQDDGKTIKLFIENYSKADILNEALNLARVEEATDLNVPKLIEIGKIENRWALITEYVEGKPLSQLMEEHPEKYGTTIEIIDNTERTEEQELVEDLIQIVTVFSCRLQGKRANKAKKMIKELIEDDTCEKS